MGKRYELPVKKRREAVLSLLRRQEPGVVIVRRYGVSEASLYRWRDEFLTAGEAVLARGTRNSASTRDRQLAEFEQQIEKRDQIIDELTVANRLAGMQTSPKPRRVQVLKLVGVAPSTWYRPALDESLRKHPGPPPKPIPEEVAKGVTTMATDNRWYGYKKIAVMCRRTHQAVTDRDAYNVMRDHSLLHKPRVRVAELYQAARLFELLPEHLNDLWQMDVTYIHIPGYGWWYAVTVIDYYSRYLLGCYLTPSYSTMEITHALMKELLPVA